MPAEHPSSTATSSHASTGRRSLESINRSRSRAGLPPLSSSDMGQASEPQASPSTLRVIRDAVVNTVTESIQSTVNVFIHQQDAKQAHASPPPVSPVIWDAEAKRAADAQPAVRSVLHQQAEQIHQQARQQHIAKIRQLAKEEIARQQGGASQAAAQPAQTAPAQPLSAPPVRLGEHYFSALASLHGVPSSSAEAEVVCAFSSAVLRGVGLAVGHTAEAVLHPIDTIMGVVSPLSALVQDAAIISAHHIPDMHPPSGAAAHDFAVMQEAQLALACHPHLYHEAVDRMQQRVEHIQATGQYLVQAPWTQQVEIGASMVTSYLLPGAMSNLVRAGVNMVGTGGLPLNPASFSSWYPHHVPKSSVPTLSLEQVRNIKGTTQAYFVVMEDGSVVMAPTYYMVKTPTPLIERVGVRPVGGETSVRVMHIDLSKGKPVQSSGLVQIMDGQIDWIKNLSGHYWPYAHDLKTRTESAFQKYGYVEAKGKFTCVVQELVQSQQKMGVSPSGMSLGGNRERPPLGGFSSPEGGRGGVLNVLAEGLKQLRQQQEAFDASQAAQPSPFFAALSDVLTQMGEALVQGAQLSMPAAQPSPFFAALSDVLTRMGEHLGQGGQLSMPSAQGEFSIGEASIQRAQLFIEDVREEYSGGIFWGDALTPQTHFLYRGEGEGPSTVFKEGFAARGSNTSVFEHVNPIPGQPLNSAYVATSTSKGVASTFPQEPALTSAFVYEINPQKNAIKVEKVLRLFLKEGLLNSVDYERYWWERERAVPGKISPQDIKGAWRVKIYDVMTDAHIEYLRTIQEPFIPNPSYVPPPPPTLGRWMYAGKMLGHGITGAAVVLDGMSLAHEFQQSTQSGDYNNFYREGARIGGGWGGAWLAGPIWAERFARACALVPALGPYGPPVCGLVGGVAGSIVGYMKGGQVAGTLYDMRTAQHPSAQVVQSTFVQGNGFTCRVETRGDGARVGKCEVDSNVKAQASHPSAQIVKSEVVQADGLTCRVETRGDGARVGKCEVNGDVKAQAKAGQNQQKAPAATQQKPPGLVAAPVGGIVENVIARGLQLQREQEKKEAQEKEAQKRLAEKEVRDRSLNPIPSLIPLAQGNTTPTVYRYNPSYPYHYNNRPLFQHTPYISDADISRMLWLCNSASDRHSIQSYLNSRMNVGYGYGSGTANFSNALYLTNLVSSYNRNINPGSWVRGLTWRYRETGGVEGKTAVIEDMLNSDAHAEAEEMLMCFPADRVPTSNRLMKQVAQELTTAYLNHGTLPFFSLHFNNDFNQYPVIHPAFQGTLVGKVIAILDYFMKGFLNGGVFDEAFLESWPETMNRDENYLKGACIDLKKYCKKEVPGLNYISLREMGSRCGLKDEKSEAGSAYSQPFQTSFRIIAEQRGIQRDGNVLVFTDPTFNVEYTADPSPEKKKSLEEEHKARGAYPEEYDNMLRCYSQMAEEIKNKMPQLPFCKPLFDLLLFANAFCYLLVTLKKIGKVPVFDEEDATALHAAAAEAKDVTPHLADEKDEKQETYAVPNIFPPLPTRSFHTYDMRITLAQVLQLLTNTPENKQAADVAFSHPFTDGNVLGLDENITQKIKLVLTHLVSTELTQPERLGANASFEINEEEIERLTQRTSAYIYACTKNAYVQINRALLRMLKPLSGDRNIPLSPEDAAFASEVKDTKPGGFLRGESLLPPLNSTGYTARPPNTSRDFLRDNALKETSILKGERYKIKQIMAQPILQRIASVQQALPECMAVIEERWEKNPAFTHETMVREFPPHFRQDMRDKFKEIGEETAKDLQGFVFACKRACGRLTPQEIAAPAPILTEEQKKTEETAKNEIQHIEHAINEIVLADQLILQVQQAKATNLVNTLRHIETQYPQEIQSVKNEIAELQKRRASELSTAVLGLQQHRAAQLATIPAHLHALNAANIAAFTGPLDAKVVALQKMIAEGPKKKVGAVAAIQAEKEIDIFEFIEVLDQEIMSQQEVLAAAPKQKADLIAAKQKENITFVAECDKEIARLGNLAKEMQEGLASFCPDLEKWRKEIAAAPNKKATFILTANTLLAEHKIKRFQENATKVREGKCKALAIGALEAVRTEQLAQSTKHIQHFSESLLENVSTANRPMTEKYTHSKMGFAGRELDAQTGSYYKIYGGCGMNLPNLQSQSIPHAEQFNHTLLAATNTPKDPDTPTKFAHNHQTYTTFKLRVRDARYTPHAKSSPTTEAQQAFLSLTKEPTIPEGRIEALPTIPIDPSGARPIHYAAAMFNSAMFHRFPVAQWQVRDTLGNTPLHYAAESGNVEVISALLATYPDVLTVKNHRGTTALMMAIEYGQLEAVKAFIAHNPAIINDRLPNGLFPLYVALQNSSEEMACWLIEHVPSLDVNQDVDSKMTALHVAIDSGATKAALLLIEKSASCTAKRKSDGFSPLHCAAKKGNVACMQAMAAKGVSLTTPIESGKTVLHLAAESGQLECVNYLIAQRVDVINDQTTDQENALMLAIKAGHLEVAEILAHKPRINQINTHQQTASLMALQYGMPSVRDILIERGENTAFKDKKGYDLIHYLVRNGEGTRFAALWEAKKIEVNRGPDLLMLAAHYGHFFIVYDLLAAGVKGHHTAALVRYAVMADEIGYARKSLSKEHALVAAENGSLRCLAWLLQKYPAAELHIENLLKASLENNQPAAFEMLLKHCRDVNASLDNTGNTALHIAVAYGACAAVELLLEKRAPDIARRNHTGQTPFHIALLQGDHLLLERLFELSNPSEWPADIWLPSAKKRKAKIREILTTYHAKYVKLEQAPLEEKVADPLPHQQATELKDMVLDDALHKGLLRLQHLFDAQDFDEAANLLEEDATLLALFTSKQGAHLFQQIFENMDDNAESLDSLRKALAEEKDDSDEKSEMEDQLSSLTCDRLLKLLKEKGIHPALFTGKNNVLMAMLEASSDDLACYRLEIFSTYFPASLTILAMDECETDVRVVQAALALKKIKLYKALNKHAGKPMPNAEPLYGLHEAVIANQYDLVRYLLTEEGYAANSINAQKQTPFMLAAAKDNVPMMELLLQHGANVNQVDLHGQNALHHAIHQKSESAALHLLPLLRKKNQPDREGVTPLMLAASKGLLPVVRYICSQGDYTESVDQNGCNALHYAAQFGQADVVSCLVAQEFSPNVAESPSDPKKQEKTLKRTPLHLAALAGHASTVSKLMALGADPQQEDTQQNAAYEYAVKGKNTEVLAMLQCAQERASKLLFAAAKTNNIDVLSQLILAKVNQNAVGKYGLTALHLAAIHDAGEVAELLLKGTRKEHSSKATDMACNATDQLGNTPLYYAAHLGHVRIINALCEADTDINYKNQDQATALFTAAEEGKLGAVISLLIYKADFSIPNAQGITPAQAALLNGHLEIVARLQLAGDTSLQKEAIDTLSDAATKEKLMRAHKDMHSHAEHGNESMASLLRSHGLYAVSPAPQPMPAATPQSISLKV